MPLDWLEDIRQIEESLCRPEPPRADAPALAEALTAPPPAQPPAAPSAPLPTTSPVQRGYDPDTGQIVDPATYALWQRAEAQRRQDEQQKQPALSVAEAFLAAQRAVQVWVDADANRPLIESGDMETIRQSPAVQELLRRYEGYGPVMREKLCNRLALLVDNRRKFFKAFG
jgi:hypothetical protein